MGLNPTGLNRPGVFHLALTLVLGLGSTMTALGDDLVPADIAFTPPKAEQQLDSDESITDTPAEPVSTVTPESPASEAPEISSTEEPVEPPAQHCSQNPNLHKTLTIGSFTRLDPQSANAGNLYDVELGVAQLFRRHLRDHPIINPQLLSLGINNTLSEAQQQRNAQQLARRMGTQFVLQGFIADMSMDDPDSLYNPGLYRKAANLYLDLSGSQTREKRYRQFAVNMELRDGYTGEVLQTKTYSTSGIWPVRNPVGFNSTAFRNSDYAQKINQLIKQASNELAQTIACQPFIVSIDAAPGRTQIFLAGGANNGLHAGDQLELYQLVISPSNTEYMRTETRLVKRNARVQLNEVYPSHSTAILPDGEYLNGAFLAVSD
jgi:hypothetical protein